MSKFIAESPENDSSVNRAASAPTSSISSSREMNVPARLLIFTGSPPRWNDTNWYSTISSASGS